MRDGQFAMRVRSVLQVGGLAGPEGAAGGVWSVASMQTEALRSGGLDVVLLGTWLGPLPPQREKSQKDILRVRRPFPGSGLRGLYSFAFLRRVNSEAKHIDIAHIHLCRDFITVLSLIIIARRGVPIVVQTHGMLTKPTNWLIRLYDFVVTRRLVRIPKLWLTLTEQEEDTLKILGVKNERIERIVNATARTESTWTDPSEALCVFIARLAVRKQPRVFVEAALRLLDEGIEARFVLAGPDQGEAKHLDRIIRDSGHSHRFEIMGHVAPREVHRLLAGATVFVLPAKDEPYPMAVIEAASVGTPIVLTRECGLAPVIDLANAGILIDPDIESTVTAMRKVIESPELRKTLSANALILHQSIWSVESLADTLAEKYERSTNGN